jgi:hypothetical protein
MQMTASSPCYAIPARPMSPRQSACVVCGASARAPSAADPYPTCHAIACRMVVSRRADMGEASFRHYLQRHAQQKREQMALVAVTKARRQAEAEANARTWTALYAFARLPSGPAAAPLRLLLPSGPGRARPLTSARRERYRAHLLAVAKIAAAMAPGTPRAAAIDAAAPSPLPSRLCALCGGGCCTRGSDHAYLGAPTLRRFMDAHPALSPEEVVAAYLERITNKTQAGSCINHTRSGCSLPRDMRSDTCNDFACASLAEVQAAPREQVVLVVRRKQDQWRRDRVDLDNAVNGAAVLSETGVRRMRIG